MDSKTIKFAKLTVRHGSVSGAGPGAAVGELLCPRCGYDCLHDGGPSFEDGLTVIPFSCESCSDPFGPADLKLVFEQHKGNCWIYWRWG